MLNSWRDFEHCKVTIVRARVEEILRRVSGPKVLEVGCNEGWVAKAIQEELGFSVTACDNRKEAVQQAKDLFGIEAVLANANDLPFGDASFDCVVVGELLEHLSNPGKGLSEAFRVSRGHVIATLPVGQYWNGEKTHAWQINGSMVDHESGFPIVFFKHNLIVEFRAIRQITPEGQYADIGRGSFEDR